MKRKKRKGTGIGGFVTIAIAVVVLVGFIGGVRNVSTGSGEQEMIQLERAIRRSAIACYAIEGHYPPSLEYMKEHYGVIVDEEKFTVYYEVQGINLMPQIIIVEKAG